MLRLLADAAAGSVVKIRCVTRAGVGLILIAFALACLWVEVRRSASASLWIASACACVCVKIRQGSKAGVSVFFAFTFARLGVEVGCSTIAIWGIAFARTSRCVEVGLVRWA